MAEDTELINIQNTDEQQNDVDTTEKLDLKNNENLQADEDTIIKDDKEIQDENTDFNPDELEFEENESDFTFGDYNLSKFKDDINLTDDNIRNFLNDKAKILKEKGFSQNQVEFILEEEIKEARAKQITKSTKEDIIKDLKENLTIQERKDYKNVGSYLKESLKGTELESYYTEAMSNPIVYKLIHSLYTKTLSGKPVEIGTTKDTKEIKKESKTLEQATNEYLDYLSKNLFTSEDKTKGIENIIKDLSKEDKEKFKKIYLKK